MSYDIETAIDALPPTPNIVTADRRDLEAIVTLLELAAVYLTPTPDATFTVEELLIEAHRLGGDEVRIEVDDVKIVLGKAGFLKKLKGGLLCLK
jgi:hypothetical protein